MHELKELHLHLFSMLSSLFILLFLGNFIGLMLFVRFIHTHYIIAIKLFIIVYLCILKPLQYLKLKKVNLQGI